MSATVILKRVRIAFPVFFTATQYEGKGPFTYSCTGLMAPESEAAKLMDKTIKDVAKAAWADDAGKVLKTITGNNQKICYYPGELKDYDGFAGMMALSCKRPKEAGHPKVIDQKKNELASEDGKPYGGCYVNLKVDIWAQDNKFGKGIRATLVAVQFVADGDAFTATGPSNTEGFNEEESDDNDAGDDLA